MLITSSDCRQRHCSRFGYRTPTARRCWQTHSQHPCAARRTSSSGSRPVLCDQGTENGGRLVRDGLNGLAVVGLIDLSDTGSQVVGGAMTVHPVVADVNRS
jgi:hypothetical protein